MAKGRGPEDKLKLADAVDSTRDAGDVKKDEADTATKQEANIIREQMLGQIVEMRKKGLFSEEDKNDWNRKIEDTKSDQTYLREKQQELQHERERAEEIQALFDEAVHDAEHEGRLRRGEHEQLDQKFLETRLAERQKMLDDVRKELHERVEKIRLFSKLAEEIREVRRKPLDAAKFWDEKKEILEGSEKMDENLKQYAGLWAEALKSGKIAKDTWDKKPDGYKYWFLSLTLDEQKDAIRKAKKEDIDPRAEAWEIHHSLPKEYQNSDFNRMGLKDRQRVLREIEAKLDREFGTKLREGKSVFSQKEYNFFQTEYDRPQRDVKTTLSRKISFLNMIEKQTKAEKELWMQFEKIPDAVRKMFAKEFDKENFETRFDKEDFETRVKLLKEILGIAERHNKCLQTLNDLDPHISESVRDNFEKAKTIEDKEKFVKRAQKFQESKNRCYKKLETNAKYFQSGIETHKHIYEQQVHSLEDALAMEGKLVKMIEARKKIGERTKKLHPLLRDRFDENQKLSDREKQLDELEDVNKAYQNGSVQFLIKSGENAKKRGDINEAFAHYFQALKLDPKNKMFQHILAGLRQRGATMEHISPVSHEDEQNIDALMARVDATPVLAKEAEELAIQQLLMNLSKKNIERTGANTESTAEQRHHRNIDRVQDKDEQQLARDLEPANQGEYILGEDDTYRKEIELKTDGKTTEETKRRVDVMLGQKVHKGAAAESGLSEVRTVDSSGKEVGWAAANKALQDRREKFQAKRKKGQEGAAIQKLGTKKAKAAMAKRAKEESEEDELVESELEKLTA